jgi:hypothetical protein
LSRNASESAKMLGELPPFSAHCPLISIYRRQRTKLVLYCQQQREIAGVSQNGLPGKRLLGKSPNATSQGTPSIRSGASTLVPGLLRSSLHCRLQSMEYHQLVCEISSGQMSMQFHRTSCNFGTGVNIPMGSRTTTCTGLTLTALAKMFQEAVLNNSTITSEDGCEVLRSRADLVPHHRMCPATTKQQIFTVLT